MKISEKKLPDSRMELKIQIPIERVEAEYNTIFEKIKRTAKIDGFRPGKAPVHLVEQKFANRVHEEVLDNLMRKTLSEAVESNNIRVVDAPEYTPGNLLRGTPFEFTAVMDVYPTIELGKYADIPIEERACNIEESDIQNELNNFCEQHAKLEKLESAKIENGNYVKVNVQRLDAEEGSDEAEPRDFTIIVGKSQDKYSLDKYMIGLEVGQEKETEIKYPKDYHVAEFAGSKIKYKIKPIEINKMEIPKLDDELAKEAGFESVEKLKERVKKQLESVVRSRTVEYAKGDILEAIVKGSKFEIPNSMIIAETENVFRKSKEQIAVRSGISMEKLEDVQPEFLAQLAGEDPKKYKQMLTERAIDSIKSSLALREIAKKENLKVSEEKFKSFVDKYAQEFGKSTQEIEKIIKESKTRENIEDDLMIETVIDYLYDNAKIKKLKPMSFDELLKTK